MADLNLTTGVDLRGLRTGLQAARTQINTFKGGVGSLTLNLILNYRGPSAAQLGAITAALNAMRAAAGSMPSINFGGLGIVSVATAAGLSAAAKGLYESARAADAARVSHELFHNQLVRNNQDLGQGAAAVTELSSALNITQQQAEDALSQFVKQGASIQQAVFYAKAGASSALAMGRDAAAGVDAISQTMASGISNMLNGIGVAENYSTFLQKVAKESGKTVDELNKLEKNKAMEQLLTTAVVASGEMEGLATMTGGFAGSTGKLKTSWDEFKKTLGTEFVAGFSRGMNVAAEALTRFAGVLPTVTGGLKTIVGPIALAGVAYTVYARQAAIATASSGMFVAAQARIAAMGSMLIANPWVAAIAAIGLAINLATSYYNKVAEENERKNAAFDQRLKDSDSSTAGTEFDQRARTYTMAIMGLEDRLAAAKKKADDLFEASKGNYALVDQAVKAQEEADKVAKKLETVGDMLKHVQDEASDAAALPEFTKQLQDLQAGIRNEGMDGLAKSLDKINTQYNGLRATIETTFKTAEARSKAARDVENLRAQAIAQAKSALGDELTKSLADMQRKAEKERVDAMSDGMAKRSRQRQAEIDEVERKGQEELKKYKGLQREPEIREATRQAVAAVIAKWDADDKAWTQKQTQEARKRSETIRQTELDGYKEVADARVQVAEYGYQTELKKAEGNAAAILRIEVENASKIADEKSKAVQAQFASQSQKLSSDLAAKLDDPKLNASDRSAWMAQYARDMAALRAKSGAELTQIAGEAEQKVQDATKAAREAAENIAAAQRTTAQAAASYGVETAQNALDQAAAQQRVVAALKEELAARQELLNNSGAETDEKREERKQAVLAAQLAVLQAQHDARDQLVSAVEREFDVMQQHSDLLAQITVSEQVRQSLAAERRESMLREANFYQQQAERATAEGASLDEINGLLDKRDAAQRRIVQSMEESRKAAIGEARAVLDSQLNTAKAALEDAQSLTQRTAARQALAEKLAEERALNEELIGVYTAQGRSQGDINPLLEKRTSLTRELSTLDKQQVEDLKKQAEAQRSLTSDVADFNAEMRDLQAVSFGDELKNALLDADSALKQAGESSEALNRTLREQAAGGQVAEDSVKDVSAAMQRASSDTSKAAESVKKLRSMYDALKSSADALAGSLGELAGRAEDQQMFDQIEQRADRNEKSALDNMRQVIATFGQDSVEAANAMKAVVDANRAHGEAVRAGLENQVKDLERQKAILESATVGAVSGADAVKLSVAEIDAKISALKDEGDTRIRQGAQALSQSLSGAMGTVNALDDAAAKTLDKGKKLSDQVKGVAKGQTIGTDLKINPDSVTPVGKLIGDAFVARINERAGEILALERRAPVGGVAGNNVTYSGNVTYNLNLGNAGSMGPDVERLARQLCQTVSARNRRTNATRG